MSGIALATVVLAAIPSPSTGVLHVGPIPLRAYAFMIILGVLVAIVVTDRRLQARGQPPGLAADAAAWAVPFGIVGARIYHVITSPDAYFGAGGHPLDAFKIWHGGLGIWGGVAGGALGVWLACRHRGTPFGLFADAAAPGLVLAQAVGRWGNWFNQELYGRATDLPWAVRIDRGHQLVPGVSLYHPTFLYESLWDVGVAGVLLWVDRRRRLGRGKLFVLYVALYTAGRGWIEALRIDEAHTFLGMRLNDWVSIVVFVVAVTAMVVLRRPVDPPATVGPAQGPLTADAGSQGVDTASSDAGSSDAGSPDAATDFGPQPVPGEVPQSGR